MVKKVKIIISGAIIYKVTTFLYARFFWHFPPGSRVDVNIAVLFGVIIAPFLLGLIISIILKGKYDWVYSIITFYVYFIINSLLQLKFFRFSISIELHYVKQHFLYGAIPETLFTVIGGLIGHYVNSKRQILRRCLRMTSKGINED